MHSMWELGRWLDDGPFVLTTVDTIFREEEFSAFVQTFISLLETGEADGLMGVTDYIDDEKPLLSVQMTICGLPHFWTIVTIRVMSVRVSTP